MTDVNVAFVVQTYLVYMWTNDTKFFDDLYPAAMRALTWLVKDATRGKSIWYLLIRGEWPSGLNSIRAVTAVTLDRAKSNCGWVTSEA